MNIKELLGGENLEKDYDKITTELLKEQSDFDIGKAWKEYDGDHAILTDPIRKDEIIGEGTEARIVKPAKEIVTLQEKIVETAIAFTFGKKMKLSIQDKTDENQNAFELILDVWKNTKLNYFNKKLMRHVCIEKEAAELWQYSEDLEKLQVILLSRKQGYDFAAHYDESGDMDGFIIEYDAKEYDDNGRIKKYKHRNIYTAQNFYAGKRIRGRTWEVKVVKNPYNKIPIILYQQRKTEWANVQTEIDRFETMISEHADLNQYFAGPILKLWGKLKNAPNKEDQGKMLEFESEVSDDGKERKADAEFLEWQHSPESLELEFKNLWRIIHSMTYTPDVSFESVKGIGNVSGITLKLMFLDPLIKAMNKEEIYGQGLTRRLNLLKVMIGTKQIKFKKALDQLEIDLEFQNILPTNLIETVDMLMSATGGDKILSQASAVEQMPLVNNPVDELEKIRNEESENEGGTFNIRA